MRILPLMVLLTLGLAPNLGAQATPERFASLRFDQFALAYPPLSPALSGPASRAQPAGNDHTVAGLLIGAGLGIAAGWLMYDAICEAVDNRCSDSRLRLVMLGGGVGGALGALLGSLTE